MTTPTADHDSPAQSTPLSCAPGCAPGRALGLVQARGTYLRWLALAFGFFNTVRVLAYLPTVLAIVEAGESSQHSLLTWLSWLGANATMAAWLYEFNGRRLDRTVVINLCNAAMCLATSLVIGWFRWT